MTNLTPSQTQTLKRLTRLYNQIMDAYEVIDLITKINSSKQDSLRNKHQSSKFNYFKELIPGKFVRSNRLKSIPDLIVTQTLAEIRKRYSTKELDNAMMMVLQYTSVPRTGYEIEDLIKTNAVSPDLNGPCNLIKHHLRHELIKLNNTPIR